MRTHPKFVESASRLVGIEPSDLASYEERGDLVDALPRWGSSSVANESVHRMCAETKGKLLRYSFGWDEADDDLVTYRSRYCRRVRILRWQRY